MTYEDQIREYLETPLQIGLSKKQDELTRLQERWTELIRNHGFKIVKQEGDNKMTKPDLFDIANEIDSFFIGLKAKK